MELINTFILESLELLDIAEKNILELERQCLNKFNRDLKENEQEYINQLFRAIHTIKGNSGLFELDKIKQLSHIFENLLSKLRDSEIPITRELIDSSLLGIDRLREIIQNLENMNQYEVQDIIQHFQNLLNKKIQNQDSLEKKEEQKIHQTKLELIFNQTIQKYSSKLKNLQNNLAKNQKIYFIISYIDIHQYLSQFVDKIEKIKKLPDIRLLNYHIIYPPIHGKMLYYLLIQTNQISELNLPITSLFLKEIDLNQNKNQKEPEKKFKEESEKIIKNIESLNETSKKEETFLKVPASLVENLINLAGESIIARNELIQKIENYAKENRDVINSTKKISTYISLLQENLMKLRLQELNVLFDRIPRLIRELSKETDKEIELEIEGGNIELDKTLIDAIRDPLTHIIRNAIDHGIELPEERQKKGKPSKGKIVIKAFLQGSNVIIKISDDGRGIDINKILQKAIEKNLIPQSRAKELTKKEIIDLIFLPGFSTAERVTDRSGRGVGMDVVKNSLRSIKGFIEIDSEVHQGTIITISIPQTLSIITCLIVQIFEQKIAIQQNQIYEITKLNQDNLFELHGGLVYELRGKIIPIIDPKYIFYHQNENDSYEYIILLETDQHIFGILVHDILNPEELMIKPLGEDFHEIPYFMGASILGDGSTILILDISGIARNFNIESNKKEILEESQIQETKQLLKEQYLIFETYGIYYGVSIKSKPRIIEVFTSQIEPLLNHYAFKYENHIIPIIDINAILNKKASVELFDKKNFYAILFDISKITKDKKTEYISLLASDIINITNEFQGIRKEENQNLFIYGYGIYMDKTIIILNIEQILNDWINNHSIIFKN
ncbi:MAG: hypothetical protein KatS3mg129_0902 [Leptospiraceae bacterium]|nr:MAG: hypothetical protein KatS3mg129_0902 [Leptospiraceae bacterium]